MDPKSDKKTGRPSQRARNSRRKENSIKKAKNRRKEGGEAWKTRTISRNFEKDAQINEQTILFLKSIRARLFDIDSQIFLIERFGTEDLEEKFTYLMLNLEYIKLLLGVFINIQTK